MSQNNRFQIDEAYLTSVTTRTVFKRQNTEEGLIDELKYGPIIATGSGDHPEFTALREQLGNDGFIKIQRGWWNGDTVLKPFYLNGVRFARSEQFSCAPAMKFRLESKRKYEQSRNKK